MLAYEMSYGYLDGGPRWMASLEVELREDVSRLDAGAVFPDELGMMLFAWKNATYMARQRPPKNQAGHRMPRTPFLIRSQEIPSTQEGTFMINMAPTYFRAMALFYVVFGLITTFAPGLMELFMTEEGKEASTAFSDQVWLHGGLDIFSVALLLVVLSTLPATGTMLYGAAIVALMPMTAILYTLLATPYWSPLFLVPAAAALAFAVWGFMLARTAPGN